MAVWICLNKSISINLFCSGLIAATRELAVTRWTISRAASAPPAQPSCSAKRPSSRGRTTTRSPWGPSWSGTSTETPSPRRPWSRFRYEFILPKGSENPKQNALLLVQHSSRHSRNLAGMFLHNSVIKSKPVFSSASREVPGPSCSCGMIWRRGFLSNFWWHRGWIK